MISQYFTAAILLAAGFAPHAQNWQRVDGCAQIDNRWNDGDSFHVSAAGQEIVARLYFVDTPEAETAYRDRLDEQAAYFGITRDQTAGDCPQGCRIHRKTAGGTGRAGGQPWGVLRLGGCIASYLPPSRDLDELLVEH